MSVHGDGGEKRLTVEEMVRDVVASEAVGVGHGVADVVLQVNPRIQRDGRQWTTLTSRAQRGQKGANSRSFRR